MKLLELFKLLFLKLLLIVFDFAKQLLSIFCLWLFLTLLYSYLTFLKLLLFHGFYYLFFEVQMVKDKIDYLNRLWTYILIFVQLF